MARGRCFERFASALPAHIRTRIIKYPQHAAQVEEYAAVVTEALPAGRVILLAESSSGIVALYLLRKHEVSVESVIFVASFGSTPQRFLKVLRPLFPVFARAIPLIPIAAWRFFCLGAAASATDIAWLKGALAQVNPSVVARRLEWRRWRKFRMARELTFRDTTSWQREIGWSHVVQRSTCGECSVISPFFVLRGRISFCRRHRLHVLS